MKLLLLGLIFISPPFLKKILMTRFSGAQLSPHAQIGWFALVSGRRVKMGAYSAVRPFTVIMVNGDVEIGHYSEISSFNLIYGSSSLIVGDETYIGPQSLINVEEPVRLGNGSALGPRSMVFTHGSYLPYTEGYWVRLAGVTVGNRVWCAAGVFLHPGVEIGDNSFVNSRSVVTQSIPPNSVVEGNPAAVIYPMDRVKRRMSPKRIDLALEQILRDFAEIGLQRELGVLRIEQSKDRLRFQYGGQLYEICLIPSTVESGATLPPTSVQRTVFLVNSPDWPVPAQSLVLNLGTMLTDFEVDPVHTNLRLFMLRYYGIRFKDQALESLSV